MADAIKIHKGRLNTIPVNLGIDITGDTITSEIRTSPTVDASLIATFDVTITDATNGELSLTLDDADRSISATKGYMDLKRLIGGTGSPVPVFDTPLEVDIQGTVTE